MTKILTTQNVKQIIQTIGFEAYILGLIKYLEDDFKRWETFEKTPRIGFYRNQGVMELMPVCGDELFAFKYVNGHPNNTQINQLTVLGVGLLAEVSTGIPLLISEMTLLTALRTAATSTMASKYLANKQIQSFGIIGNGTQSEFQTLAHQAIFNFKKVFYYDIDSKSMEKFRKNMEGEGFELIACSSTKEVCDNAEILTTCTAAVGKQELVKVGWLRPGQHLNCIGGDSPDKTEIDPEILKKAKITVEYFEQTKLEGEIQNLGQEAKDYVAAELWEVLKGLKNVRKDFDDITLYDSVGFALEDYSVLRYTYDLACKFNIFTNLEMTPELDDCKNLYSKISQKTNAHIGFDKVDHFKSRLGI